MTILPSSTSVARERLVAGVPVARLMPMADRIDAYSLRAAKEADASDVAELVDAAYGHYVERIGMVPGPMTLDYAEVVRTAV